MIFIGKTRNRRKIPIINPRNLTIALYKSNPKRDFFIPIYKQLLIYFSMLSLITSTPITTSLIY
jgi:hypothetical protein